jgi:hypothetical protein
MRQGLSVLPCSRKRADVVVGGWVWFCGPPISMNILSEPVGAQSRWYQTPTASGRGCWRLRLTAPVAHFAVEGKSLALVRHRIWVSPDASQQIAE